MDVNLSLLNYEENFEESFKEYFVNNGLSDVYTARGTETNIPDEHIEMRFDVGTHDEHLNLNIDRDLLTGILTIAIFSDRNNGKIIENFKDYHSYRKAIIRKLFLKESLNGNMTDVSEYMVPQYYNIYKLEKTNETMDMSDESGTDLSMISFEINFQVRF